VIAISVLASAEAKIVFDVLTDRGKVAVATVVTHVGAAEPWDCKNCPEVPTANI